MSDPTFPTHVEMICLTEGCGIILNGDVAADGAIVWAHETVPPFPHDPNGPSSGNAPTIEDLMLQVSQLTAAVDQLVLESLMGF